MRSPFVADFTPQQLQNASAGRRYGQRKREAITDALSALIEKWRRYANPAADDLAVLRDSLKEKL